MPAFHETLSDEQRWEIVTFVRTLAPAQPATPPSQGGR
jgi:mono/diheme cytochrome c family protein